MTPKRPEPDSERDPVEALAAEFLEKQRKGESPSISDYASRYPELAVDIQDLFPAIAAMEQAKERWVETSGGRAASGPVELERLGDYRIVREIGRGGMGIVYEAEQESLGRHVAIKVLPGQSLLEEKHLKRFRREAQVAASLHHTNIVPVFGVGEQDGLHYYVMQYIRGLGLEQIIARLAESGTTDQRSAPTEPAAPVSGDSSATILVNGTPRGGRDRSLRASQVEASRTAPSHWHYAARISLQVARALQYAHAQGVLHRDIKPANLLVDADDIVWITDFGLAKGLRSEEVTQTGDITGSLPYMAPERFKGEADARTDLYALGVTLYELLTSRRPYVASDPTAMLARIGEGSPTPPGRINSQVPQDLETIALKAMAAEPERRYQSAAALADDLQRFLDDRPIQARRVTSAERLWRWCRRNPAVASLAGATLLLVLVTAVVSTAAYVRTRNALAGEALARGKAEENAKRAAEAIEGIFDRFSPRQTAAETPTAALSKEAATLLKDLLSFYDEFVRQTVGEAQYREKIAEAKRRVGDIRQRLGQYDQAERAYRGAIGLYQEMGQALPEGVGIRLEVVRMQNEIGRLFRARRQYGEARQTHLSSLVMLGEILAEIPDSTPARYEFARTHYFLGKGIPPDPRTRDFGAHGGPFPHQHPLHQGPPARGRPPLPGGDGPRPPHAGPSPREPGGPPPVGGPQPPPVTDDSASADANADGMEHLGEEIAVPVSLNHLREAVTVLLSLNQQDSQVPGYRYLLALCYRELFSLFTSRDQARADDALLKATRLMEELAGDFPEVPDFQYDLIETYTALDTRGGYLRNEPLTVTEKRLRGALDISVRLVEAHPNVPQYLESQAQLRRKLGMALQGLGQSLEAEQSFRGAVAVQESLVRQVPDAPYHRIWLGDLRNKLAGTLLRRPFLSQETRPLLEKTIAELNALLEAKPQMQFIHGLLAESYAHLAKTMRWSRQPGLAADADQKAREHRERSQR